MFSSAPWQVHLAAVFYLLPMLFLVLWGYSLSDRGMLITFSAVSVVSAIIVMALVYSARRWGRWLAVSLPVIFGIFALLFLLEMNGVISILFTGGGLDTIGDILFLVVFGIFTVLTLPGALILAFSRKAAEYYAGEKRHSGYP